ncbi:MAG: LytTR family transcriptional regulator DNA-binding domain-containing protein [Paludibacteraceae bacterium]|nr:LytTR family transcriptional regulator DNA-binding domain-containing protein [Paludibacteraceae bacterium]
MKFSDNKAKIIQYMLWWTGFAILQTLSFHSIFSLPLYLILADAVFHSMLYALLGMLLWNALRYGNFGALPALQRIINYTALGLLTLAITAGAGYGFEYFLNLSDEFLPYLPARTFIHLLVFILIIQAFIIRNNKNNSYEQPEISVETEEPEDDLQALQNTEILERITVKSGSKINMIPVQEILCLQADGDYVHIHTLKGKYMKEQTMKSFERALPPEQFVRVHRSCIVNIESITGIELYEKQGRLLTLKNGLKIKVSQTGYATLKEKLNL